MPHATYTRNCSEQTPKRTNGRMVTCLRLGLVQFPLGLHLVPGRLVDRFARGKLGGLSRRRRLGEGLLCGRLFFLLPLLLALLLKGQPRLHHLELGGVELGGVDALPHTR